MADTSPIKLFSGELPITYPMLTDSNYGVWAVRMRILMRALGVWVAIEGDGSASEEIDREALLVISQSIPDVVVMSIYNKNTAKEAWDAIKEMHIGVGRFGIQVLKREFDTMLMEEYETIGEFALKLMNKVNQIRMLGTPVAESTVVEKLLTAVPDRFVPIVGTMTKMTLAEAIRRLKAFEEGEQLLLAGAKWESLAANERRSSGRGFRGGRNRGRGRN